MPLNLGIMRGLAAMACEFDEPFILDTLGWQPDVMPRLHYGAARARLRGERLTVPELADLEVASVLRRQMRAGTLNARRALRQGTASMSHLLWLADHTTQLSRE